MDIVVEDIVEAHPRGVIGKACAEWRVFAPGKGLLAVGCVQGGWLGRRTWADGESNQSRRADAAFQHGLRESLSRAVDQKPRPLFFSRRRWACLLCRKGVAMAYENEFSGSCSRWCGCILLTLALLLVPVWQGRAQEESSPSAEDGSGSYLTLHDLTPAPVSENNAAAATSPTALYAPEYAAAVTDVAESDVYSLEDGQIVLLSPADASPSAAESPLPGHGATGIAAPLSPDADSGQSETPYYSEELVITPPYGGRYVGARENPAYAKYSWSRAPKSGQTPQRSAPYEQTYVPQWDRSGFWDNGTDALRRRPRDSLRPYPTRPGWSSGGRSGSSR